MVYGVFGGCYSDWYVVGYFNNREDANKYCCVYGDGDYYVRPLRDLTNEKDLSQVELKYEHEVLFDCVDDQWIMREEPDRYKCYVDNKLHCNSIANDHWYSWVRFNINIDHNDRKLAEKIAQDYLAELRSYANGEVRMDNIRMMNDRFEAPFKEAERLEKERKLKRKN